MTLTNYKAKAKPRLVILININFITFKTSLGFHFHSTV